MILTKDDALRIAARTRCVLTYGTWDRDLMDLHDTLTELFEQAEEKDRQIDELEERVVELAEQSDCLLEDLE